MLVSCPRASLPNPYTHTHLSPPTILMPHTQNTPKTHQKHTCHPHYTRIRPLPCLQIPHQLLSHNLVDLVNTGGSRIHRLLPINQFGKFPPRYCTWVVILVFDGVQHLRFCKVDAVLREGWSCEEVGYQGEDGGDVFTEAFP